MNITTFPIGKPYDYISGAGNVDNRRIIFERVEAGRTDTIRARIITLPGENLLTTVNDITVKVKDAWKNKNHKLSDFSMEKQNDVIEELLYDEREMEITRLFIGGTSHISISRFLE